ncbi:MAG: hypothetical protein P4N41_16945 [Negativicutes bacterium]|nr:hypothetical protein [Negativicutes bacterium]
MTYRSGRSYVRFPESLRSVPEKNLVSASARLDQRIGSDKGNSRLVDQPGVTPTQNVYDTVETGE